MLVSGAPLIWPAGDLGYNSRLVTTFAWSSAVAQNDFIPIFVSCGTWGAPQWAGPAADSLSIKSAFPLPLPRDGTNQLPSLETGRGSAA